MAEVQPHLFEGSLGEYIGGDWHGMPELPREIQHAYGAMARHWLLGILGEALIKSGRVLQLVPVEGRQECYEVHARPPFTTEEQAIDAVAEICAEWQSRQARLPDSVVRFVDTFVPSIAVPPGRQL